MAGKTNIAWADAVWNPSVGCTRVSSGCDHCYAFALHDRRYAANKAAAQIKNPYETAYARRLGLRLPYPKQYDAPFSKAQLLPDRLDAPLRWKKPRRIFVDSMSDLFHEDVPDEFIDRVFATMAMAPQHTFLILTKRPERMRDYAGNEARPVHFSSGDRSIADASTATKVLWAAQEMCEGGVPYKEYPNGIDMEWPLPNVWLGVSIEDQATADERIPLLLRTPAAVRFVSAEPCLGPIDLRQWIGYGRGESPQRETGVCRCFERRVGSGHARQNMAVGEAGLGSVESPGAVEQVQTGESGTQDAFRLSTDPGHGQQSPDLSRGAPSSLSLPDRSHSSRPDSESQERDQGRQPARESGIDDAQRADVSRDSCIESGRGRPSARRSKSSEQVNFRTGEGDTQEAGTGGKTCSDCGGFRGGLQSDLEDMPQPALDPSRFWVIVGGETGKGHRPMNLDWPRSLRDQCQAAAVAFFYKQGSGSQPGKHRILDGRTWEEMPC